MHAKPIRIFISSPSDVRPERLIAERVIRRLAREFAYYFEVQPLLWEREPLTADAHFQARITPPRETDVVVVILWSRLGVPLPPEEFLGRLSGAPVTGTEWEFEDALAAQREQGLPDLLLYRKQAEISADLRDSEGLAERLEQHQRVEGFIRRWFMDPSGRAFTAAYHPFQDVAEFEERLEIHLRELLKQRIQGAPAEADKPTVRWHQAPFRGLLSFDFEQQEIFFGRASARTQLRELLARQAQRGCAFVLVLGASGSGKSSLVKAGLLPDLMLPGMVGQVALCRYAVIRPAGVPEDLLGGLAQGLFADNALPELAQPPLNYTPERLTELLREAPGQVLLPLEQGLDLAATQARLTTRGEARLVLVVDQLEELFTQEQVSDAARLAFVGALEALARSGRVWVIATLRSDFFQRLESLPALERLSRDARFLLAPASAAELGQIIRQPARLAGLRFEHDPRRGLSLDEVILQAASGQPGALPLLSFLLDQLWQRRGPDGVLSFADYEALGGLEGALGKRAEQVFETLPQAAREALPGVLHALVTVGAEDGATPTARVAELEEFLPGSAERALVDALLAPQARLLVAFDDGGRNRLRVAHEALLSHWPRARDLIERDLEDLRVRARLEQAEARWRQAPAADRDSLLLPPGLPLSEAEDLLARRRSELPARLTEYVAASAAAARSRERRRLRLFQGAAALFSVLMVLALGGAWLAYQGKLEAEAQSRLALSRQLAAVSADITGGRRDEAQSLGVLLAVAAQELAPSVEARATALNVMLRFQRVHAILEDGRNDRIVSAAAFSPDGRLLALGDGEAVRLYDLSAPTSPPREVEIESSVGGLVFSADGSRLFAGKADGGVQWVDPVSARSGGYLQGTTRTWSLAVSPDDKMLVTGDTNGGLQFWDLEAGEPAGPTLSAHSEKVTGLAFSPDGKRLYSAGFDGSLSVWDAINRQIVRTVDVGRAIGGLDLSPDGEKLAINALDRIQVRDADDLKLWREPESLPDLAMSLAFSPDGRRLISGHANGVTRLWAVSGFGGLTLAEEHRSAHGSAIHQVAFAPGGELAATAGANGSAALWDLSRRGPGASVPLMDTRYDMPSGLAFAPAGQLAVENLDEIVLWDPATGGASPPLSLPARWVGHAFTPDGTTLAVADQDGIQLWDPRSGTALGPRLRAHDDEVVAVAMSPDGRLLASAGKDRRIVLWDVATQRPSGAPLGLEDRPRALAFSPVGGRLAVSLASRVELWDVASSRILAVPVKDYSGGVDALAFSPNGDMLAIAGSASIQVWSLAGGPVRHLADGWTAAVRTLAFSPDGRTLAAAVDGKGALFWDVASWRPIGAGIQASGIKDLAFDHAGTALAVATEGKVRIYPFGLALGEQLCRVANRNLSQEEWALHIGPVLPYRRLCPRFPAPEGE